MPTSPAFSPEAWPIATCLHGFAPVDRDGIALHDADPEAWDDMFSQIERAGFTLAELADSHVRPADLSAERRDEFLRLAKSHGIGIPSVHLQRQSVIMPGHEERNLEYAHRTIDAAAEWGMEVFSTGLHQPFSEAQRRALWFWTAQGPQDPVDSEVWQAAVSRLRELGRHAADVGLRMSLELYEDTYLGTADSAVRLVEEIGLDNYRGRIGRLHTQVDWGWGNVAANWRTGAPPRTRYMGLSRELPAVSSRASTLPSASSQAAVRRLSSSQMPPETPSSMLSLAVIAISSPTSSRTARATPRATLARLARLPPYSSFRLLSLGLRKELAK